MDSPQDPKIRLKRLLRTAAQTVDPSKALHSEAVAQTDLLEKLNEKQFPTKMKVSIEGAELLTIKGKPGDIGPEPSDERLIELIKPLIPEPIVGPPGKDSVVPGPQGDPGKPGKDSKVPGPQGDPGKDSIVPGPQGLPGKDASTPKISVMVKAVIKELIDNKALDISNIRNTESIISAAGKVNSGSFMFNGTKYAISELMHGGGGSGGGSFTILTAVGAVDDTNTVFGFSTKPSLIISDGVSLTEKDNNGLTQWSWDAGAMQATMQVPPQNSLIAIQ